MLWRPLKLFLIGLTGRMDSEVSLACCLPVRVCAVSGGDVLCGAVLNTQNLCDWDRAEHFKDSVTIVVFPIPYPVTIVVFPTPNPVTIVVLPTPNTS